MLCHILFSVILVCFPLSSANIWAEECAGEKVAALSINGTLKSLSQVAKKVWQPSCLSKLRKAAMR